MSGAVLLGGRSLTPSWRFSSALQPVGAFRHVATGAGRDRVTGRASRLTAFAAAAGGPGRTTSVGAIAQAARSRTTDVTAPATAIRGSCRRERACTVRE